MVHAIRDVAIMTENVVALSTLKSRLKTAPIKPGVYIFTHNSKVLYIGKAVNLRNRLRTYFYHKDKLHYKVKTYKNEQQTKEQQASLATIELGNWICDKLSEKL